MTRVQAVKFVVAGGFGVGKTTFVGSISEIPPLTTEASMTTAASGIDDAAAVSSKTTTTVAMDFGRITVADDLVMYLFGTPGQDRFGFMWDDLARGALGMVVLVDTNRLDDGFPAVDYAEHLGVPFVVAVNLFEEAPRHGLDETREALDLGGHVPLVACDARSRQSVKMVLIELLSHLRSTRTGTPGAAGHPAAHASSGSR